MPRSLLAAMALLLPAIAEGQTIRGIVVDQRDRPVAGVVVPTAGQFTAVFSGVVLTDSTRVPIADAEVSLPQLSMRVLTNARGEFRLTDIPAGTHQVIVRRIGYGLFDGMLPFAVDEVVERSVLLTPVAMLDKVVVRAESALIPSFEEHRRTGLGRFLTREDLAPQEGRRLSDILTQVSGVDIVTGSGNRSWIVTNRGERSLRPASRRSP